jgi:hypothetical protein
MAAPSGTTRLTRTEFRVIRVEHDGERPYVLAAGIPKTCSGLPTLSGAFAAIQIHVTHRLVQSGDSSKLADHVDDVPRGGWSGHTARQVILEQGLRGWRR